MDYTTLFRFFGRPANGGPSPFASDEDKAFLTEETLMSELLADPILRSLARADGLDVGDIHLETLRYREAYLGRALG